MEFRLLGVLEVLDAGLPVPLGGPKQRSVLAMLLLDANRAVSTDRLVEGLWSEDPPQRSAATLQVYVSNLRKALEPGRNPGAEPSVLVHRRPGYLLAVDRTDVDLFRFEYLVDLARSLLAAGSTAAASVLFHEALALWRETPLADLTDEPFARFEIPRLEEARLGATEDRVEADLALGRDVELVPELERLVARHPYRERLHGHLMVARYRAGRQADALATYQSARELLVEELGLEPSRNLRELEAAILVQDSALTATSVADLSPATVELALAAVTGRSPEPEVVADVVAEGRGSPRQAEEALRRAVDQERSSGLQASLEVAGHAQRELIRTRHAIADRVLDRRRRSAAAPPDVDVDVDVAAAAAPRLHGDRDLCPYKGLLRFEVHDAPWYFGRERLVAELLASVASTRCTGIVGASGSGKSSLTRAGLLAALRGDALPGSAHWPTVLLTPGTDPVYELADALAPARGARSELVRDRLLDEPASVVSLARRALEGRDDDTPIIVVVDQLEELFTTCRDASMRERFFDVIVHGACDPDSPMRILAAIRGDYYGRCAEHPQFAELLSRSTLLVGPMRPDELQRAIEGPASAAGLVLEHDLVDRIFDDVGTEPGSLPLLETALLATWARREGDTLTVEGYRAAGGVGGAVANLANEVFAGMTPSEQEVAREILLRLAEPGVDNDDVRRRAALDELVVDDASGAVLSKLVDGRLVVTGDASAEVAHEALLREWPRLRAWLEEDREGRRVRRALTHSAEEWASRRADQDLLFRGTRLAAALDVEEARPASLTPLEHEFLVASRQRQERELRDARGTARRFRRFSVALALLLVSVLVAGVVALQRGSEARESETRAEFEARLRVASRLAAQSTALPSQQYDRRLLLAAEAHRRARGPETDGALLDALVAAPPRSQRSVRFETPANLPGISADGRLVAAPDSTGLVHIFDTTTGSEIRRFDTRPSGQAMIALFSHDRRWLSLGSSRGDVTVWNVADGRKVAGPLVTPSGAAYGAFDPTDRHRLFVAARDGAINVWDLSHPLQPSRELLATGVRVSDDQAFALFYVSANGDRVIVGDTAEPTAAATSIVFDAHSGEEVARVEGRPGAMSADGRLAALTRRRGAELEAVVVDVDSGEVVSAPISTVYRPAALMSFDRSASRLAITDYYDQGRVHVVDWRTGVEVVDPVEITGTGTNTLALFLDGDDLSLRNESGAQVVDLADAMGDGQRNGVVGISHRFVGLTGSDVQFAPDSRVVRTSSDAKSILVADANGGHQVEVSVPGSVEGVVVSSPDQRTMLVRRDDVVELVDRGSGRTLGSFQRFGGGDPDVAWSPDSSAVTLVYDDTDVFVWSVLGAGDPHQLDLPGDLGPRLDPYHRRVEVAWRPDGREVLVAVRAAGAAAVYDTGTGRRGIVVRHRGEFRGGVAYTPDGRTFALATVENASGSTALLVVDDTTGQVIAKRTLDHILNAFAFYDDGHHLATLSDGSGNATAQMTPLQLWDARSLFPIGGVELTGIQTRLSVDAAGKHLLIRGTEPDASVWNLQPRSWEHAACARAGRSLTRTEWERYLPGEAYAPAC